nr:siroheme synthase [Tanacetum cinerariifolium]
MNDLKDDVHDGRDELADSLKMISHCSGWDPLVFGRGGEEMDFLQLKGVQTKVIPGTGYFHVIPLWQVQRTMCSASALA